MSGVIRKSALTLILAGALGLSVGGVVGAGQIDGSRNCTPNYIRTYGDAYGNQLHIVGGAGYLWYHSVSERHLHNYYSNYQSADWSITTGGSLIAGNSYCYVG